MNPYSATIQKLGLTKESQGDAGWLWLALSKLSQVDSSESTFTDPVREVAFRLSTIEGQASQRVAQLLSSHILEAARQ
jgi:hypothetical protein